MLKFIKSHMSTIDGIEVFPIISFVIFFVFFSVLSIYVLRMRKKHVEELSQLPFEDGIEADSLNSIES